VGLPQTALICSHAVGLGCWRTKFTLRAPVTGWNQGQAGCTRQTHVRERLWHKGDNGQGAPGMPCQVGLGALSRAIFVPVVSQQSHSASPDHCGCKRFTLLSACDRWGRRSGRAHHPHMLEVGSMMLALSWASPRNPLLPLQRGLHTCLHRRSLTQCVMTAAQQLDKATKAARQLG
jgi:hypothetical protein